MVLSKQIYWRLTVKSDGMSIRLTMPFLVARYEVSNCHGNRRKVSRVFVWSYNKMSAFRGGTLFVHDSTAKMKMNR